MRNAIRDDNCEVGDEAFEEAFETFNSGEKKTWSESDLKRTARHEAGHALVYWLSGRTPSFLTIVARSDHGGYMQHGDSEGKGVYTRNELLSLVRTSLAGRACEIVYYGEEEGISTGASGDLYSATRNVENMICRYGMDSTLGMSSISGADVTTEYYSRVRDRVNQVLKEELETTIELISQNKEAIDAIVEVLLEKNQLKGDEIDEIFSRYITRK